MPPRLPDLPRCLQRLVRQIPRGRVSTCGDLAEALGSTMAARWVGMQAWDRTRAGETSAPWHRVVRRDGSPGPLAPDLTASKRERLAAEGVPLVGADVDLAACRFNRFRSGRPLERLARLQRDIGRQVSLPARSRLPRRLGGVDVAYPRPGEGRAAYALVDVESGELVWSHVIRRPVRFPYISTFLSFRELPLLLDLLDDVRRREKLPTIVLVDGTGIMHHRHAGIASHLGVAADVATIGVTKKILCGEVDIDGMAPGESRPVIHQDRLVGVALRVGAGSRRPIFVSPGHRVDVAFAEQAVRSVLVGHRLPEPIHWADRLSRS